METHDHSINSLFEQLGLGSSNRDIFQFIKTHAPLPETVELPKADFWNASQAAFLQQAIEDDADWAEVVDQLDARLRVGD